MECKLEDIVAIMDMDGFQVNRQFLCKELGLLKIGDVEAKSFFFDINVEWRNLTNKDRQTCNYIKNRIHKLPFGVPRGTKAFQITELDTIVQNFYREIQINSNSGMAYKGGTYERDLLKRLKIPSVDLESFHCPKAENLFDQLVWLETCGNHVQVNAYHHCAKVEVEAYAAWMKKSL